MHMADALISPAVGGTMWAATAGAIAFCSGKVRSEPDNLRVPLMGVLGAFVFAVQMINFTIPFTGSSGHLGGGLLLSILLGPHAAFLTIASVLVVQALFFADGGLLALGCNIFNLGVFPAFIAYPMIYRKIAGPEPGRPRLGMAAVVAATAGLQLGAFCVVLETVASGIASLPLHTFALLMQPIHLAIGVVEGLVTAAVVSFVHAARPEILHPPTDARHAGNRPLRGVLVTFLAAALITGGGMARFASHYPDGLEWAMARVTGGKGLRGPDHGMHGAMTSLQAKTSFLPDYSFGMPADPGKEKKAPEPGGLGTSFPGIAGGVITLAVALLLGVVLRKGSQPAG